MINKNNTRTTVILLLATLMAFFVGTASADATLQAKLKQCQAEFATSNDKNASQEKGLIANFNHLKLMKEILVDLNKKDMDRKMSTEDIQEHLMVMSHLMEMMVTENIAEKMYNLEVQY